MKTTPSSKTKVAPAVAQPRRVRRMRKSDHLSRLEDTWHNRHVFFYIRSLERRGCVLYEGPFEGIVECFHTDEAKYDGSADLRRVIKTSGMMVVQARNGRYGRHDVHIKDVQLQPTAQFHKRKLSCSRWPGCGCAKQYRAEGSANDKAQATPTEK